MTRVPTYASYTNMINQSLNIKSKLDLYNYQTITGLKAPKYSGYGSQAYSIVSLEAALGVTQNFMSNNDILNVEINAQNTATSSIKDSINDFKTMLLNFSGMDLDKINPDITGGEITFTNGDPNDYLGQTITIDGVEYTFTDDPDLENGIDLTQVIADAGTHTEEENAEAIMNALKDALPANPDYKFDKNKFEFPLYTINGSSSVLNMDGVETGEPHTMTDEQYQTMQQIQQQAFSTMKAIVDSLNTYVNGKYIFGGGVSNHAPIEFPFATLEEFQAYYDGSNIKYPSNASANLSNWEFSPEQLGEITLERDDTTTNNATITAGNAGGFLQNKVTSGPETTGNLTFDKEKNTINATQYGAFNNLKAGDTLVLGGNDAGGNAKAYVIKSVSEDGKTITVEDTNGGITEDMVVPNGGDITFGSSFPVGSVIDMEGFGNNVSPQVQVTGISDDGTQLYVTVDPSRFPENGAPLTFPERGSWSLTSSSYYQGGDLSSEQRISENQSITMDITGGDPAFEKLFRALGEIAQGNLTTSLDPTQDFEGLIDFDNTSDRVQNALDLIGEGLFNSGKTSSQVNGDLYTIQSKIDSNMVIMNKTTENQKLVEVNLQNSISSMKNVDQTEAAIMALLASNNLSVSYSILQQAMSTSLLNFI